MAEMEPVTGTADNRSGFLAEAFTWRGPFGKAGLRSLLLVWFAGMGCLAQAERQCAEPEEGPAAEKRFSDLQIVQRGQRLYRCAGCACCHGPEGKGGVANPNYIGDTFPRLDQMAAKLSLALPEDVDVVVDLLNAGSPLDDPSKIDVRKADVVAAKYGFIVSMITNGSQAGKKDPQGPEPTHMPPFKDVLTESEINQLLASFLVLYPVDEEE